MILRGGLFLASLGLFAYIVYRYTLYLPPDHGTVYGKIFPLSALLAASGIALAVQPFVFRDLRGVAGAGIRFGLTGLSGFWMATGLLCTRTLARGVVAAPLGGAFDLLHMVSDHVVLPLGIVALVWVPARLARRLGGDTRVPALSNVRYGTTSG
jgi:hypothetical protein